MRKLRTIPNFIDKLVKINESRLKTRIFDGSSFGFRKFGTWKLKIRKKYRMKSTWRTNERMNETGNGKAIGQDFEIRRKLGEESGENEEKRREKEKKRNEKWKELTNFYEILHDLMHLILSKRSTFIPEVKIEENVLDRTIFHQFWIFGRLGTFPPQLRCGGLFLRCGAVRWSNLTKSPKSDFWCWSFDLFAGQKTFAHLADPAILFITLFFSILLFSCHPSIKRWPPPLPCLQNSVLSIGQGRTRLLCYFCPILQNEIKSSKRLRAQVDRMDRNSVIR